MTDIYSSLPSWVEDEPRFVLGGPIRTGQPLPAELENAPWGEAQPSGLRMAWLLDPRAEQHRLGTPLKSRILFHNSGKNVVVFRALTWNQTGAHTALDATGGKIEITSTYWTTIPRIIACRLSPGEFMEVTGAGIGVGADIDKAKSPEVRVGSWIKAKAGDEVTFTAASIAMSGRRDEVGGVGGVGEVGEVGEVAKPTWWHDFIKERLSLDSPLPSDAAERRHLLDRAVRDLFGTPPTPQETWDFLDDRAPQAMDALVQRLAQRTGVSIFAGSLSSGSTKFRVLPSEPDEK